MEGDSEPACTHGPFCLWCNPVGPPPPDPREARLKADADAIVRVARMLPKVRIYREGGERIHPHMPEDDDALRRTVVALIDRGDHLARELQRTREWANKLGEKWYKNQPITYEDFEDGPHASGAVYEWQKSRERIEWAAEHRHMGAFNAKP